MNIESIAGWTPTHLEDAAAYVTAAHEHWVEHFSTMRAGVEGLGWKGRGGDEALEVALGDEQAAIRASFPLMDAALTLQTAAADLTEGQHTILDRIGVAHADSYTVTVNDRVKVDDALFGNGYPNQEVAEERHTAARNHAMDISSAISSWQAHKTLMASRIAGHDAELQAAGHIFAAGGHMDNGQCDDPDYQSRVERQFAASVLGGMAVGGLTGGPLGMFTVGATAGIVDLIHEAAGDGPSCQ